jgi:myosin heavy subunit
LADALHIPPQDLLKESLTARQFQSAGRASAYSVPLTVQQAKDNRDALCQTMYGSMFNWIVAKVNQTLSAPLAGKKTTVIGVLDIFGFEIFEVRRYHKVCVARY